jgi:bacterioferritin-associated ferredoxin
MDTINVDMSKLSKDEIKAYAEQALKAKLRSKINAKKHAEQMKAKGYKRVTMYVPIAAQGECIDAVKAVIQQHENDALSNQVATAQYQSH